MLSGENRFLIQGPAGQLELLTLAAKEAADAKGVVVICHPHPLYGGTMDNKVVHTLSRAFYRQGLHSVRFNFRGVGKSEGAFGHSEGEGEDLAAVLAWVDQVLPDQKIVLAGFSFGAYIAARGALIHSCQQLYSIAPSVSHQPYDVLPLLSCSWIVIQGEADEVVSPQAVYEWFEKRQLSESSMKLLKIPEASHFFHGHLITLRTLVEESLLL